MPRFPSMEAMRAVSSPQTKAPAPIFSWMSKEKSVPRIRSPRSEEHTSELQSRENLVCRLLLEKKKNKKRRMSKKQQKRKKNKNDNTVNDTTTKQTRNSSTSYKYQKLN